MLAVICIYSRTKSTVKYAANNAQVKVAKSSTEPRLFIFIALLVEKLLQFLTLFIFFLVLCVHEDLCCTVHPKSDKYPFAVLCVYNANVRHMADPF